MQSLNPFSFPSYAIASGASTPVPSEGTGSVVWSTTTASLLVWNGSSWGALAASGGGGGVSSVPYKIPSGSTHTIHANSQEVIGVPLYIVAGGVLYLQNGGCLVNKTGKTA